MKTPLSEIEIDCLRKLLNTAADLGVPIVAVGATARWLAFNLPNGIPLYRTTTDWDFGVRVPDWKSFEELRRALLAQSDYFSSGRQEHEIHHRASGIRIDLVPFGGLENEGRIRWPDSALEMTVFGFSDAMESAVSLNLAPDVNLPVASVPLLVALKLFAFADRKNRTNRDLSDVWHIIQNYTIDGRESELYDPPLSAAVDEGFDWGHAGPLLLGYDVGRASREKTVERLIPVLHDLTNPYCQGISSLVSQTRSADEEESDRRRIAESFRWLLNGLQTSRLSQDPD